jgi:hypothetical protein
MEMEILDVMVRDKGRYDGEGPHLGVGFFSGKMDVGCIVIL